MKNLTFLFLLFLITYSSGQDVGGQLTSWQIGMLDIHHINTGRGDTAFAIFPDGTTLLIDAGDMSETHPRTTSSRNTSLVPNRSKTASEWIVDYIDKFLTVNRSRQLDYALLTHYHDDHFGELDSLRQEHEAGYKLTGITEVGSLIPIKHLIDRGFDFPINLKSESVQKQSRFSKDTYGLIPTLVNYWDFISYQSQRNGLQNTALKVGSNSQIVLLNKADEYPQFYVRNIASNGVIWSGEKEQTFSLFGSGDYPGENPLSNCIKISYGKFDYFTGGDISGIDAFGATDLNALESHIAPVVGPVDVASLNHHGNRDSQNSFYVRTLRPRVWVQQNWTADHPGEEVLRRITSIELYPGERDIFSTVLLDGTKEVIGDILDAYKSQEGHIVIRVRPGGNSYEVFILNDKNLRREIISKHGPYESR